MKEAHKNPLDDLFRKTLNGELLPDRLPLEPDESLWNDIEKQLPGKKHRPGLGRLYLLLLLIIPAGFIFYYTGPKNSTVNSAASGMQTVQDKNLAVNTNAPPQGVALNSKPDELPSTQSQENSIPTEVKPSYNQQVFNTPPTNQKSSLSTVRTLPAKHQENEANAFMIHTSTPAGSIVQTETLASSPVAEPTVNSRYFSINDQHTSLGSPFKHIAGKNITTIPFEYSATNTFCSLPLAAINETNLTNSILSPKDGSKASPEKPLSKSGADDGINTIARRDTVQKHISYPLFYIAGSISYMNNSKQVDANPTLYNYYLQKRRSDEQSQNSLNYSLNIGAQWKHFQVESGICYLNYSDRIKYEKRGLGYDLKSAGYYSGDHAYIYKYDTTRFVTKNDSLAKRNGVQTSSYIGIPLKAWYIFTVQSATIQIGGGITGLFPHQSNSYYINKEVNGLESPLSEKMLSPTLFDANAGAGIVLPFGSHLEAILSLEYSRNLNNIFKKEYQVIQKYRGVGAGISVRYNFRKK